MKYSIKYDNKIDLEEVLEKALTSTKLREARKQIKDPYLRYVKREVDEVFVKVMQAMMEDIYDLFFPGKIKKTMGDFEVFENEFIEDLEKAKKSEGTLVYTPVMVNGKKGTYSSHRWMSIAESKSNLGKLYKVNNWNSYSFKKINGKTGVGKYFNIDSIINSYRQFYDLKSKDENIKAKDIPGIDKFIKNYFEAKPTDKNSNRYCKDTIKNIYSGKNIDDDYRVKNIYDNKLYNTEHIIKAYRRDNSNLMIDDYVKKNFKKEATSVDKNFQKLYDDLIPPIEVKLYDKMHSDKSRVGKLFKSNDKNKLDIKQFNIRITKFRSMFKNGIKTPLGDRVYDREDRYFHILRGHHRDVWRDDALEDIKKTIETPDSIIERISRGKTSIVYIYRLDDKDTMWVAVRGDNIISAYHVENGKVEIKKQEAIDNEEVLYESQRY